MIYLKTKKGFTLIELLMAISIFVVIATISTSLLVRTVNVEKLTDIRNTMVDDARVLMEQLTSAIHYGQIDYEEYYSVNVIQNGAQDVAYGLYYGAYGSRFMSPGDAAFRNGAMLFGTDLYNPDNLGIDCAVPEGAPPMCCDVSYTDSKDKNMGQNFYSEDLDSGATSNAFYDAVSGQGANVLGDSFPADELYILANNVEGKVEELIAAKREIKQEEGDSDYALAVTTMNGYDLDGNDVIDFFKCPEGASCHVTGDGTDVDKYYTGYPVSYTAAANAADVGGYSLPYKSDHEGTFVFGGNNSFQPITPFRTSIENIKFIIAPVDDPYKAYAEPSMRMHPTVTIILTVEPSIDDKKRYPGGWPGDEARVTIERTVTAGLKDEISSFPPTDDMSWICNVLGQQGPYGCNFYDYAICPAS